MNVHPAISSSDESLQSLEEDLGDGGRLNQDLVYIRGECEEVRVPHFNLMEETEVRKLPGEGSFGQLAQRRGVGVLSERPRAQEEAKVFPFIVKFHIVPEGGGDPLGALELLLGPEGDDHHLALVDLE